MILKRISSKKLASVKQNQRPEKRLIAVTCAHLIARIRSVGRQLRGPYLGSNQASVTVRSMKCLIKHRTSDGRVASAATLQRLPLDRRWLRPKRTRRSPPTIQISAAFEHLMMGLTGFPSEAVPVAAAPVFVDHALASWTD